MTKIEKIVFSTVCGLIATLFGALIIATVNWLRRKKEDQVLLADNLEATADIEIMNVIGCAGLSLTIISRSKRVIKVAESYISLVADHVILESFSKGFNFPFEKDSSPDLPAPKLIIKLLPLCKPSENGIYILERDDVCKFFIPITLPFIKKFINAPSEDVCICVKCLNGDEIVLMKGLKVQDHIRTLIDMHGGLPGKLKVNLVVNLKTSSTKPQDSSGLFGNTNPNNIDFE